MFWQIGVSATLGTGTDFVGTVMANTSITAASGTDVEGRLLARTASVFLNNNVITNPACDDSEGGGDLDEDGGGGEDADEDDDEDDDGDNDGDNDDGDNDDGDNDDGDNDDGDNDDDNDDGDNDDGDNDDNGDGNGNGDNDNGDERQRRQRRWQWQWGQRQRRLEGQRRSEGQPANWPGGHHRDGDQPPLSPAVDDGRTRSFWRNCGRGARVAAQARALVTADAQRPQAHHADATHWASEICRAGAGGAARHARRTRFSMGHHQCWISVNVAR